MKFVKYDWLDDWVTSDLSGLESKSSLRAGYKFTIYEQTRERLSQIATGYKRSRALKSLTNLKLRTLSKVFTKRFILTSSSRKSPINAGPSYGTELY